MLEEPFLQDSHHHFFPYAYMTFLNKTSEVLPLPDLRLLTVSLVVVTIHTRLTPSFINILFFAAFVFINEFLNLFFCYFTVFENFKHIIRNLSSFCPIVVIPVCHCGNY